MRLCPLPALMASLLALVTASACTPADVGYCQRQGLPPGTPQFGDCLERYHYLDNLYQIDRAFCDDQARDTYPDYLYDRGRRAETTVVGRDGRVRTMRLDIGADEARNSGVDLLRDRIIRPCMLKKGWNDPYNPQFGKQGAR